MTHPPSHSAAKPVINSPVNSASISLQFLLMSTHEIVTHKIPRKVQIKMQQDLKQTLNPEHKLIPENIIVQAATIGRTDISHFSLLSIQ